VDADLILYRALHPAWSFAPLSLEGAAVKGGRWSRFGHPALYLATDPMTALAEYNQDFQFHPVTLGQFRVVGANLADLSDTACLKALAIAPSIHDVPWYLHVVQREEPPQWGICDHISASGYDGLIYPSAQNPLGKYVVLWRWNDGTAPTVSVSERDHRLPIDQPSWTS
jgi:RES domain-containing protein